MESSHAVMALAALAQETRLAIFRLLVEAGPDGLAAGRIGELLSVPPATLSFHLKELSHAGMVASRQDGRFIYYSADYPRMAALMGFLTKNCCQGMPSDCLSIVESALDRCCGAVASRRGGSRSDQSRAAPVRATLTRSTPSRRKS